MGKRKDVMVLLLVAFALLVGGVSASAGATSKMSQAEIAARVIAVEQASLAASNKILGQAQYKSKMDQLVVDCGCNPPCQNTSFNRTESLTYNRRVYVIFNVDGAGYYPGCYFNYHSHINAYTSTFDGGNAWLRWWYCGTPQTPVKSANAYGLSDVGATAPPTRKYYGSCGPQADNLDTWWALGGEVETISTTSDDQYMNETTWF